jgi:peptidoglycan/xylan/chitin deacetylase (PgdA/CDA1 family)
MSLSLKAKSVLTSLMYGAGIVERRLQRNPETDAVVLMYHRVIPRREMGAAVQPGMVVEPETLDMHLRFLRRHFEIVPLAHVVEERSNDRQQGKRRCALTFDDGWQDFYEHAYPVLKAHAAPATVFLPTDFIGTSRWFWTDRLGLLFDRIKTLSAGQGEVGRVMDEEWGDLPGDAAQRLELAIAKLKSRRSEDIEAVIARVAAAAGEQAIPAQRAFLTWEEVREMRESGLVEFGSHTAGHLLLTTVTEDEALAELRNSYTALVGRGMADAHGITFSYPNGNCSPRLSEMVREEGYALAVTTEAGWHRAGADPFLMRRIAIHQDVTATEAMFAARIAGLF